MLLLGRGHEATDNLAMVTLLFCLNEQPAGADNCEGRLPGVKGSDQELDFFCVRLCSSPLPYSVVMTVGGFPEKEWWMGGCCERDADDDSQE